MFIRIVDGARAVLIGITETDAWPPAHRVLYLEGEDGTKYMVSDWAFKTDWRPA